MKIIPKNKLITLLQMDSRNYYSISELSDIFETFGKEIKENAAKTQQGGFDAGQCSTAFPE